MNPYLKQYKWSNIFEMIRNLKAEPKTCAEDFHQRLVVITGATSGIGLAAAETYAARGAELVVINRSEKKSQELCAALRERFNARCTYILADFSKRADVHSAARQLLALDKKIDVLIHNAGIYLTTRTITADGMEAVFQTNYLSTFILNHYLKERFKAQGSGRILFVNSEAYRFAAAGLNLEDLSWEKHAYAGIKGYAAAKLAQLLSMLLWEEFFRGSGVTINAMHPGNIKTNSGQDNGWLYKKLKALLIDSSARPIQVAAEALYYLGASPEVEQVSGKFFNLTTIEAPAPPALDREAAIKLWKLSLNMGGLDE